MFNILYPQNPPVRPWYYPQQPQYPFHNMYPPQRPQFYPSHSYFHPQQLQINKQTTLSKLDNEIIELENIKKSLLKRCIEYIAHNMDKLNLDKLVDLNRDLRKLVFKYLIKRDKKISRLLD